MATILSFLPTISLCVGGWVLVNGVLHDVFVLRSEHGKQYNRELLRLLMDGHILITCGAIQMIAFKGLQADDSLALYAVGIASISLLVYCGLIFPFLKSFVTMLLNAALLLAVAAHFFSAG